MHVGGGMGGGEAEGEACGRCAWWHSAPSHFISGSEARGMIVA